MAQAKNLQSHSNPRLGHIGHFCLGYWFVNLRVDFGLWVFGKFGKVLGLFGLSFSSIWSL
jgi:hypothetical protein